MRRNKPGCMCLLVHMHTSQPGITETLNISRLLSENQGPESVSLSSRVLLNVYTCELINSLIAWYWGTSNCYHFTTARITLFSLVWDGGYICSLASKLKAAIQELVSWKGSIYSNELGNNGAEWLFGETGTQWLTISEHPTEGNQYFIAAHRDKYVQTRMF